MLTTSAKKSSPDRLLVRSWMDSCSASSKRDFVSTVSSKDDDTLASFDLRVARANATECAFSIADLRRSSSVLLSRDCTAEKMIANPKTIEMSSSGAICSSFAASSSSLAILKLTDTLRSDPIELSIPNVVPPTPPVTCVPPNVVGAPLIVDFSNACVLSNEEVRAAGYDRVLALGPFFDYQKNAAIYVRRLVLTLPCLTSGKRTRDIAKAHGNVTVCGNAFGTTLGAVCAYLEGRGIPAEKAWVLRSVRTQLLPIADALKSMRGTDAVFLSRGLASCRVAHAQRDCIRETLSKIDSKYGNAYTCLGTTSAILACFGVMSAVHVHGQHLVADQSLVKTLRCSMEQMDHWRSSCVSMPDDAWEALAAERRALRRATDAARLASYVYQDEPPLELLARQIGWAKIAAFPPNRLVDETTQWAILRELETQTLFESASVGGRGESMTTNVNETVPLSQIGEGRLLSKRMAKCDAMSDTSSSWVTLSSNASSGFTSVSGGSLDGELVGRLARI